MATDNAYYTEKLVVSGQLVEHYSYEIPVRCGQLPKTKPQRKVEPNELISTYREDNANRAATNVRRLCAANSGAYGHNSAKMLTLTFAENLTDLPTANREFELYIKRLNRYLRLCGDIEPTDKVRYLAVGEQQKRGAWHYHVALFNMKWLPVAEYGRIWGNGFAHIAPITSFEGLERYVSKYFAKKFADDKLTGSQAYHGSKDLLKPYVHTESRYYGSDGIQDTVLGEAVQQCQFSYPTDFNGVCTYTKAYADNNTMYNYLTHGK